MNIATTTIPEVPVPFELHSPIRAVEGPDEGLIDALIRVLPIVATRDPDTGADGVALDQTAWHCGTAQCTAGWVRALAGVPWITDHPGEDFVVAPDPNGAEDSVPIWDYARDRLGITVEQAAVLFQSNRTLPQIMAVLAAIRNGVTDPDALLDLCAEVDPWAPMNRGLYLSGYRDDLEG